jgi:hypothetical protein
MMLERVAENGAVQKSTALHHSLDKGLPELQKYIIIKEMRRCKNA